MVSRCSRFQQLFIIQYTIKQLFFFFRHIQISNYITITLDFLRTFKFTSTLITYTYNYCICFALALNLLIVALLVKHLGYSEIYRCD